MAPRRALLVMDLINEIVHPDGRYAAEGYLEQVTARGVLERAATAIARAREAAVPVVYVVVGFSAGHPECPTGSPIFETARVERRLTLGTWATQVHESIAPREGEPVVAKHRINPFFGTDLDVLLRTQRIETLLLTGVATELVVLSTAAAAADRDYRVEVLEDATATAGKELHDAAVAVMGRFATITSVDEALPPGGSR
ncbi:isochorismatase family cysteine hydrolase [Actinomycetes bacterium KLBMP 9759]